MTEFVSSTDLSGETEEGASSRARSLVISNKNNGKIYTIKRQLGKGGYGTVFLCLDYKNRIRALKVEKDPALTQEIKIFKEAKNKKCIHIAKMYDYGTCNELVDPFILMTCLGKNLSDVKKRLPKKMFTINTTLRVLMQTLSAIRELHSLGYVSRDVKPSNFCVGRPTIAPKSIFIIDFGVARDFRNDNESTIINKNTVTTFKGTVRYCSLANHFFRRQCRRDDIESWFYMSYEFFEGKLPWQRISRKYRQRIKDIKTILRTPTPKMFAKTPKFMYNLLLDIDKIKFLEKPNYDYIHNLLHTTFIESNYSYDELYDWELQTIPSLFEENLEEELTTEN
ncbi:Protein kinase domain and Serine/threonine-/dual specificity protein kinase, catalytic domain and Protein kinase-like domain-containing protein [Strongyloides ratti]|uniref:Protein kinase domain and Serine/threonine-/dual specificity protein kinase, catalytic domain and Protein kinase-like domain-containing protein n=1 Tax=Strongyloides ratti TaxID=34506 RepID=A0A090L2E5_STRRB|nr:Protein kinase domain and Serine/threonine-/dual specificity protein kinase, catalytic domain and Protein kinase-like domain-containing protein [Strongyloides ratti]CEF62252.1 Protein kinase domain and Serine/threonine-/dual specificity protein kinase, catalytic domain and Protein kinase-like domain-containing protein [Strongyloides ratti]